jgi:glycosyltransferase involved in cell wall biosynthesis
MDKKLRSSPKVSVIIPSYNYAQYLVHSLESVLSQEFKDFEVIVVDDGSTDNTRELVASYDDPRVRYIFQENKGMAETRNTGIRAAKGKLIALLDADDRWLPHKLTKQVNLFDQALDLDFVFGESEMIDEKGDVTGVIKLQKALPYPTLYENLLGKNIIPGSASSVMISKACFEEVGLFDHACGGLADLDMWRRVTKDHPCQGIPEILTQIRVHQASVTYAKRAYMAEGMIACILRATAEVGQEERYQVALKFAQKRMYTHACWYFLMDAVQDYRTHANESEIVNCDHAFGAWMNIPDMPVGLSNLDLWYGKMIESMCVFFSSDLKEIQFQLDGVEVLCRTLQRYEYIDVKKGNENRKRGNSIVLFNNSKRLYSLKPWLARKYAILALINSPVLLQNHDWLKVLLGKNVIRVLGRFRSN